MAFFFYHGSSLALSIMGAKLRRDAAGESEMDGGYRASSRE